MDAACSSCCSAFGPPGYGSRAPLGSPPTTHLPILPTYLAGPSSCLPNHPHGRTPRPNPAAKQPIVFGHHLNRMDSHLIASLLQHNDITLSDGRLLHAHIVRKGIQSHTYLGNLLVCLYRKLGSLHDARLVFLKMLQPSVVSWNAMITACSQHGHANEALQLFWQMQRQDVEPNQVTFICVLGACTILANLEEGRAVHACIRHCDVDSNVMLGNSLINMYGKCGAIQEARAVFDKLQMRTIVSWNTMIDIYSNHGNGKEALVVFQKMQQQNVKPDRVTLICVVGACATLADLEESKAIHSYIMDTRFESDVVIGNALINMYGKCGALEAANSVFTKLPQLNVVSWNAIVTAYSYHGQGHKALQLFRKMKQQGVEPNEVTFISMLGACALPEALAVGKAIHAEIMDTRCESHLVIANALINMYGKCGALKDALSVFNIMGQRNVISWTAIITAYSEHGHGKEALQLFQKMKQADVEPNDVTFVCLLSACSHAGLLDEGHYFFASMVDEYSITPTLKHYSCMIDLLGRAGRLEEAEKMIGRISVQPDPQIWMTLLGACRVHKDVERGERVAQHLFNLIPQNAATYVQLSNIYAAVGRWDDVEKVREAMVLRGVKKITGCSWIEVGDRVHEFYLGDRAHPKTEEIYAELERLSQQMMENGFVPGTTNVLHDDTEELKEHLLWDHSEKLAIAFGLISSPPETPISVTKNLRICPDCHTATKHISKIVRREIIIRDMNWSHHFWDGNCTCGDYW